jgi:hypothetical protein
MYARFPERKIPHSFAAQDIFHSGTQCLADFYELHYLCIMKRGKPGRE